MNRRLPVEDTLPWYRQFWPWFLILLPGSVVVAAFVTLYIANQHADDLVVDDYYKNGLAINRQLEKKERAAQRGITAELAFSSHTVTLRTSQAVRAGELFLLMSHPLESDRDFEATLSRIAPGYYRGELARPVAPRWHWTLELRTPDGWRLDGSVSPAEIGDASFD